MSMPHRKPLRSSEIFATGINRELAARAFGHVLHAARSEQGFSQQELAALSEIDADYISLVERGLRTPSIAIIQHLAAGLGLHADALIDRAYDRIDILTGASTSPNEHQLKASGLEVQPFWRTDV